MANNHNNGTELAQPASQPVSQCLYHAFLSEPRPELKRVKTQVNCVSVCTRAKLKRDQVRRTDERVNELTNEQKTALGSSNLYSTYMCVMCIQLNKKNENITLVTIGLVWKYNRMTSSSLVCMLLLLLLMLLSLLPSPLPSSLPSLPSQPPPLQLQLYLYIEITCLSGISENSLQYWLWKCLTLISQYHPLSHSISICKIFTQCKIKFTHRQAYINRPI